MIGVFEGFGDPKVHDFGEEAALGGGKEDIGGFEIAVDDPFVVGVSHSVQDREEDILEFGKRQRAIVGIEESVEVLAFHPIHRHPQKRRIVDQFKDANDPRMLKLELDFGLFSKAFDRIFLGDEIFVQKLDRDCGFKFSVSGLENGRLSSASDFFLDQIVADDFSFERLKGKHEADPFQRK